MFNSSVVNAFLESLYNINDDIKVHAYNRHIHAYTRKDTTTLNSTYNIQNPKLSPVLLANNVAKATVQRNY
jgi:hypothetical protein